MARRTENPNDILDVIPANPWKQVPWWARFAAVAAVVTLVLLVVGWQMCYVYVPPGKLRVVVAKNGTPLPPNQVLAKKGQKGVQEQVLAEGYHFVTPFLYTTELKELTVVPPGKVGIVTALGGDRPADDHILVDADSEQGIRRQVLLPGKYRINPYGYTVDVVDRVEIPPGSVGVQRRKLGKDGSLRFADKDGDKPADTRAAKGILRDVLQPGLYYLNTREFEIIKCEVGIDQTTYGGQTTSRGHRPALAFPARDGFDISLECTIEWEVLPADWPTLAADHGTMENIERNVIDVQVEKICRDRGFNYGADDFLDGVKREAFQNDFQREFENACREKNVLVRSAFIRNITIPERYLLQRRKLQLSVETQLTNKERQETAKSEADVEREQKDIEAEVGRLKAETTAQVAKIEQETLNLQRLTEAEIERTKSEYTAQIASLEAQKKRELGVAEADVKTLTETAKSAIFKLRLDVFDNNGDAYLRYAAAKQMNPDLRLRLFHSGPGTFWTNLDGGKNFNLMIAPQSGAKATPEK